MIVQDILETQYIQYCLTLKTILFLLYLSPGRWVLTKMTDETHILDNIPSDDSDLLGDIQAELDDRASKRDLLTTVTVKETFYYDTLEVPADADDGTIRRRYYLMAKKYHPDRQPSGDQEAAEKFKEIAEAYQVLSDPELRKRYDRDGRDGLSADKTSTADGMAKVDPAVLYAFLFGSDQFNDYVGRLATATSASVGDSPKVSAKTAKLLQKRRLVRLAVSLLKKIEPHVIAQEHGEEPMEVEDSWTAEALELSKASYGYEMLQCIGQSYNLMGAMYQGSINSGQGLPSVSAWAARQRAILDKKKSQNKNTMGGVRAGVDMLKMQQELMIKMQQAKAVDEREALEKEMNDAAVGIMLRVLWTTTVVDVTSTLYEMTHMIFFDQDVPKDVRWRRSEAVKALGSIFMSVPEPEDSQDQDLKQMYEDAAFAAMLETVKRRDAATK